MKMLKTIAVIVVIAIAIVLVLAAMKPDTFRVARSTSIKAPPEKIFALINDFHQFNTWNPYAKKDPAYKGVYSGPAAGVGAKHAWESKEVGVGSMEIIESTPPSKVKLKLDFVKPFEAHNIVD
ncbi:MAG: SRPBCC family protein, partial [Hyphomicrobium sp.]